MSHEVITLNKRSFKKTQKSKPELCGTSHFRGKQRKGKGGRRKMKGKASAWRRERLVGGATKNTKSISTLKSIYCETSKSTTLFLFGNQETFGGLYKRRSLKGRRSGHFAKT